MPDRVVAAAHCLPRAGQHVLLGQVATFIGKVYKPLGLNNIADAALANAGDYPQLSSEYIVTANPYLIVLADTKCCRQDPRPCRAARMVGHRSGPLGTGRAADDDIVSRWGPRVVELYRLVAEAVVVIERVQRRGQAV